MRLLLSFFSCLCYLIYCGLKTVPHPHVFSGVLSRYVERVLATAIKKPCWSRAFEIYFFFSSDGLFPPCFEAAIHSPTSFMLANDQCSEHLPSFSLMRSTEVS